MPIGDIRSGQEEVSLYHVAGNSFGNRHYDALYYNKDIFDKFGVPCPNDDMAWDDLIPLGAKLTRMVDNVQYRGLEANFSARAASQLRLPYVDPETKKAAVNSTGWKDLLAFLNQIYQIPGNQEYAKNVKAINQFLKDQSLAMLPINNFLPNIETVKNKFTNWDMVSYPYFKEYPHKSRAYEGHMLWPTSASKYPDAASLVIQEILSDDSLMAMSSSGSLVAVNDTKYKDAFAKDLDFAKGKNIGAVFKTILPVEEVEISNDDAAKVVDNLFASEIVTGKNDINSTLRDAEEKINQMLKDEASK